MTNSLRIALACLFATMQLPAHAVDAKVPHLVTATDEWARAAGIGLLRDTPLPSGTIEIRVWAGLGLVQPFDFFRVRVSAGQRAQGDVLRFFSSEIRRSNRPDIVQFHHEIVAGCTIVQQSDSFDVCTSDLRHKPDWQKLHEQLMKSGIATLPDAADVRGNDVQLVDGFVTVIEVREGQTYRGYQFPQGKFQIAGVSKIEKLILDVLKLRKTWPEFQ